MRPWWQIHGLRFSDAGIRADSDVMKVNHWAHILVTAFDLNFDFPFLGCQQEQGAGIYQGTRYVGSSY